MVTFTTLLDNGTYTHGGLTFTVSAGAFSLTKAQALRYSGPLAKLRRAGLIVKQ